MTYDEVHEVDQGHYKMGETGLEFVGKIKNMQGKVFFA
jgi:hypothetical protein